MTIKRPSPQITLLDVPPEFKADSTASARNAYGQAAQYLVCKHLRLNPISTDGRFDICFDGELDGTFYEIKSVKKGGGLVIYRFRLEKEKAAGVPVIYAVLIHRLYGVRNNIVEELQKHTITIRLFPLSRIVEVVQGLPLHIPKNKRYSKRDGYTRGGYALGYYNVPIAAI